MNDSVRENEALARSLNDPARRAEYAKPFDTYRPGLIARFLGGMMIGVGNCIYGKEPSYAKCKAIEVMARVPYQSWEMAVYTLLTVLYTNEHRAMQLANTNAFSRLAQDNETMHVVVISQIVARDKSGGFIRHTLLPFLISFKYFVTVYILYLLSPRAALELNYLFESHAYAQYSTLLEQEGAKLRHRPVTSAYLKFYGCDVTNEYELFELIRNDELIHRNRSIRELRTYATTR